LCASPDWAWNAAKRARTKGENTAKYRTRVVEMSSGLFPSATPELRESSARARFKPAPPVESYKSLHRMPLLPGARRPMEWRRFPRREDIPRPWRAPRCATGLPTTPSAARIGGEQWRHPRQFTARAAAEADHPWHIPAFLFERPRRESISSRTPALTQSRIAVRVVQASSSFSEGNVVLSSAPFHRESSFTSVPFDLAYVKVVRGSACTLCNEANRAAHRALMWIGPSRNQTSCDRPGPLSGLLGGDASAS